VLVVEKQWMGEPEFLSAMTMCRILPGANQVNMAVFWNSKMRGLLGGRGCADAGDGHPNREEVPDGAGAGLALRGRVRPERHSAVATSGRLGHPRTDRAGLGVPQGTAVGYGAGLTVGGVPGAIVGGLIATAAMLLPAASLMYVVTLFWQNAQRSKWRLAVEKGFVPLTVGLIMAPSLVMSRAADHDWRAYTLTAGPR
jgi:chromate transport protein ChrA